MSFNFHNVDNVLRTHRNPEIWHYSASLHPGVNWYIKTILPNHPANNNATDIVRFWHKLESLYPKQILITETAFDWNGNKIQFCNTIWLNKKIDIKIKIDDLGKFDYDILDYDEGLHDSAKELLLLEPLTPELLDAVEFLIRFTPDKKSKLLRSKLKVLDVLQHKTNK
jgi:hypothetical protein